MFVTVRYGEDESKLFNINCRNEVLLYQIKKKCKMDIDEVIDLSDEQGVVKNLRQNLDQYASENLKERETVILLRVDSCGSDPVDSLDECESLPERFLYIPMLTGMTENQEFIDTLNSKENAASKTAQVDDADKGKKQKAKDKKKDGKKTTTNKLTVPVK